MDLRNEDGLGMMPSPATCQEANPRGGDKLKKPSQNLLSTDSANHSDSLKNFQNDESEPGKKEGKSKIHLEATSSSNASS